MTFPTYVHAYLVHEVNSSKIEFFFITQWAATNAKTRENKLYLLNYGNECYTNKS